MITEQTFKTLKIAHGELRGAIGWLESVRHQQDFPQELDSQLELLKTILGQIRDSALKEKAESELGFLADF